MDTHTMLRAAGCAAALFAGTAAAAETLSTATRTSVVLPVTERLKEDVVEKRYEVPVVVPAEAAERRVAVTFDMVNTRADVFLDGEPAGTCVFPCGEVDVTALAKPGKTQTLAIAAGAYPPQEGALVFNAPDRAEFRKINLRNRGLTGAVRLETMPSGPRIADSTVETSVERGEITFVADLAGLPADAEGARYVLSASVAGCGEKERRFESGPLAPGADGTVRFTASWPDARLWDTHTPENLYSCTLSLRAAGGALLDEALPFRFGFREVRLVGRDILLNGVPIHLRAQVSKVMNQTDGSHKRGLDAATNLLARGWNFVIADNYNFRPGCLSATEGFLSACDDTGLLCSFTLPSLNDFDEGKLRNDPETQRVFRELTRQAVRMARRHPSVIFYAMNHNRLGYAGDMDPVRIGVGYDIVSEIDADPDLGPSMQWMVWRRRVGEQCRAVAEAEDPTRPVYHHSSGDLGRFHTCNIYLDFIPVQERSDWLADWHKRGTKPVFFVEWGAPHIANWSSYRGPLFIHSKNIFQSLWASEYAAEFRGEAAYEPTPEARAALAGEEALWEKGAFRWWQLAAFLRPLTNNYHGVVARYVSDNWRSHRAWGCSAMLPWDQGDDFLREGVLSPRGEAFARWNAPECAFIGGDGVFTDKRHLFRPGETVRKSLVILNDRRVPATVRYRAVFAPMVKGAAGGKATLVAEGKVEVPAGGRRDVPVSFVLPEGADGGTLAATFNYGGGAAPQTDTFAVRAVRPPKRGDPPEKLLLYDPKGLTKTTFDRLGIDYEETDLKKPLPPRVRLVIGREALTPAIYRRRLLQVFDTFTFGRVLVFEQTAETLSAIGFRVQEHGLRQVFPRYESAFLPGLDDPELLRDWAGEATLLPPHLEDCPDIEWSYGTAERDGFVQRREWRCRERGTVASVIPQKPSYGDWRAYCDGGFALEYAPLLEQRCEKGNEPRRDRGSILWCQLDVTARTEPDPEADEIVRSLVCSLTKNISGKDKAIALTPAAWHLARALTLDFQQDPKAEPDPDPQHRVYIATTGAEKPDGLDKAVEAGARVLCLGLSAGEVAAWSPVPLACVETNGCFSTPITEPPRELKGLSAADLYWHGTMSLAAFTEPAPDGNEAFRVVRRGKGCYVFWQTPPSAFDEEARPALRGTKRHAWIALSRILSNLGCAWSASGVGYRDAPVADDDPYRYFRW